MKKLTIEYVGQKFKEEGYELLSKEYKNAHIGLDIVCSDGHRESTTWNKFQQGIHCAVCAGNKRKTIEHVRQMFIKEKYTLLSNEYKNAHTKLFYICPEGHKGSINWSRFQRGNRCGECVGVVDPKRKLLMIKQCFEKEGYQLLANQYVNPSIKLEYLCPKGHRGMIRWNSFRQGNRCAECAGFVDPKIKIEQVRQKFAECGYTLLSDQYTHAHADLMFICSKGHKNHISWTNFYNLGHRCSKCWEPKSEKKLGEILEVLFLGKVRRQDNLGFLGLKRIDYSVRDLKLAFEYDGQHHFFPTRYGNMSEKKAQERFITQQQRDQLKNKLCKKNGYKLIRIAYYEALTPEDVQRKIHG